MTAPRSITHRMMDTTALRQRAEEKARAVGDQDLEALSPEEVRRLVHELRVRQLELEMQNEALRRSHEERDLILDSLPGYIVYLDQGMNVLHANRALAEWLGYYKDALVGRQAEEMARPGSYEYNLPYFEQALESRQTVTYELESVSVSGQYAFARATVVPLLDEQGNVQGIVVYMQDITAQRRAEEALKASEEQHRLLVENMHEGVVVIDDHSLITYVNDTLCEMSGWTRDELLGQPTSNFIPADQYEEVLVNLARRSAGLADNHEAILTSREGVRIPVLISASPVKDHEGNFQGSLAVVTDITERVKMEDELRRHVEELTVLNQISHAMTSAAELPAILTRTCKITLDLFAAHCVHILWQEGEETGRHLHVQRDSGPGQAGPTPFSTSLDDLTAAGLMLRQAGPQIVADVRTMPLPDHLLVHPEVQSAMCIPLAIGGKAVGLLWIGKEQLGHAFTANEMTLAETIAVDLAAAIERTQLVRQAQEAAISEERSRLARELHDSVTQTLYSVSILAEALPRVLERDPEAAKRSARLMRQVVLGAVAEMRTLLFELRPEALEAADLRVLLGQLADSLRGRSRVNVDLKLDDKVELPPGIRVGLYRIAQEAFNNIVRHAHARNVTGVLQDLPERVLLTIRDDGQGFDPASVPAERMGLRIMHERAKQCGLQLMIESQVGRGTTVAVVWQKAEAQRTEGIVQ